MLVIAGRLEKGVTSLYFEPTQSNEPSSYRIMKFRNMSRLNMSAVNTVWTIEIVDLIKYIEKTLVTDYGNQICVIPVDRIK